MTDGMLLAIVIIAFWLTGLALCVGVPIGVIKLFHIRVSPWLVGGIAALAWIVGTYIWWNRPI